MSLDPSPAARIAARARRLRRVGAAGALALLAAFSGLAAARVADGGTSGAVAPASGATVRAFPDPAAPAGDAYFGEGPQGSVAPADPAGGPADAVSGAS